jgi:hypothetical protein
MAALSGGGGGGGTCLTLTALKRRRRRRREEQEDDDSPPPTNPNYFVRLHPATARRLWQNAAIASVAQQDSFLPSNNNDNDDVPMRSSWSMLADEKGTSERVSSGIEFLPLELALLLPPQQRRIDSSSKMGGGGDDADCCYVYASYNGGDAPEGTLITCYGIRRRTNHPGRRSNNMVPCCDVPRAGPMSESVFNIFH